MEAASMVPVATPALFRTGTLIHSNSETDLPAPVQLALPVLDG